MNQVIYRNLYQNARTIGENYAIYSISPYETSARANLFVNVVA